METGAEIRSKAGRTQVRGARAIGYVRVSRVGGRGGETFISPDVQRETIARKAETGGLELVRLEEDFDESGGKYERPGFQRALDAIEAGEASVIVVARLDRFARSVLDTHKAIERVERAGGRLVACDLDVDTSTASGRMQRGMFATLAEFERERIAEGWATARARAVERGVKIGTRANLGYTFGPGRRLEVDEETSGLVVELYQRRAAGASWTELEELLEERGVELSRQGLMRTLANRVYLGESKSGDYVNVAAHDAIVPLELFDAVQARWRPSRRYDRAVRSMLAGIARCGTCGASMRRSGVGQAHVGQYACKNRACSARASVSERRLDDRVGELLLEWATELDVADETLTASSDPSTRRPELEQAVADAELGLEAFVTSPDNFGLEPALFQRGVQARKVRLEELRTELAALGEADVVTTVRATLRQAWPLLGSADRRRLLDGVVDRVVVARSSSAKRGAQPIEERVRVVLVTGRVLS